jgi:hypothetical protein
VSGYLGLNVSEEMLERNEPIPDGVITMPLEAADLIPYALNDDERAGDFVSPVLQFLSVPFSVLMLTRRTERRQRVLLDGVQHVPSWPGGNVVRCGNRPGRMK